MAFQACARAVLTKCLRSRALFPRMQHVVVYATSPALTPPKLDLRNSTSSRTIGSRSFSFTFLTMRPESIYLNAQLLYNVLDAAYGAEIREMIILLWKYAPIMAVVDRVIAAGQIKVDKAEVDKINEKIEKLPLDTVKQLIVQMDKLGMNETLRVTGFDKIKADFEKNMADFGKSKIASISIWLHLIVTWQSLFTMTVKLWNHALSWRLKMLMLQNWQRL